MTKSGPGDKCVPVYLSLAFAGEGQAGSGLVGLHALFAFGAEFAAGIAMQVLGVRLFGAFQRCRRAGLLGLAVSFAAVGGRHLAGRGHLLVAGSTLRCRSEGSAGGNRTAAWCVRNDGLDLSCRMVADGMAARWDRYWRGHRC